MRTRRIGDIQVSAIGLGGMPMSIQGPPTKAAPSPRYTRRSTRA